MPRAPRRSQKKARQAVEPSRAVAEPRPPPAPPAPSTSRAGRVRAKVVARLKLLHPMD